MTRPSLLIIGGSGTIGRQSAMEAAERGYSVDSVGLDRSDTLPADVVQHVVDRDEPDAFERFLESNKHKKWDVVFDVIAFSRRHVEQTLSCFGKDARTLFVSTTLVYDRRGRPQGRIPSDHPLAKRGELGGYVDGKLEVEEAIRSQRETIRWTILRPYHVLGPASPVGCVPFHNRDTFLADHIRDGKQLTLCDTTLSVVHPRDIGRTALAAAGKEAAYGKAYNVVNADEPVTTGQYHDLIGDLVGRKPCIAWVTAREAWGKSRGWALTALPHLYDTDDLRSDTGYSPDTPPKRCIDDAICDPRHGLAMHERMNKPPQPLSYFDLFEDELHEEIAALRPSMETLPRDILGSFVTLGDVAPEYEGLFSLDWLEGGWGISREKAQSIVDALVDAGLLQIRDRVAGEQYYSMRDAARLLAKTRIRRK